MRAPSNTQPTDRIDYMFLARLDGRTPSYERDEYVPEPEVTRVLTRADQARANVLLLKRF